MRDRNCSSVIEKESFNWNCELAQYFQISVKYIVYMQFMAASALLKNTVSIEHGFSPSPPPLQWGDLI